MLLGRTGDESLVRRVEKFDTVHVADDVTHSVKKMLYGYTEMDARLVSAGAGTFFVWVGIFYKLSCKIRVNHFINNRKQNKLEYNNRFIHAYQELN